MTLALPPLPYALNALEPAVSAPALALHHERIFGAHLRETARLLRGTALVDAPLEEVVRRGWGGLREQAALAWNHDFFFRCMKPGGSTPAQEIREVVEDRFGSLERFTDRFVDEAVRLVGSGFIWLVVTADGGVHIDAARDSECPLREVGTTPLLCLDVWEHAYLLDHADDRERWARSFFPLVDWGFVLSNWRRRVVVPMKPARTQQQPPRDPTSEPAATGS